MHRWMNRWIDQVDSTGILSDLFLLFLYPGGAIIISPNQTIIDNVGRVYAGRASSSPIVDLFITLLSMGLNGYKRLLQERNDMLQTFPTQLETVARKYGERLLICPSNTISFGITLDTLARPQNVEETDDHYAKSAARDISSFGAMLFARCVSGTRVVPTAQKKIMSGEEFMGFGSSTNNYHSSYMTAACAIGVSKIEIDEFFVRLDKTLGEHAGKQQKQLQKQQQQHQEAGKVLSGE
jgi:O-phospho-L-seryl-tRNASec:L-selenocysteinyl-tRNA synthase